MADFLGTAITAHMAWRNRLLKVIVERTVLDPAPVRSDCNCALGKWLYGEGKQHAHLRQFACVVENHRAFHVAAADVVESVAAGRIDEAKNSVDRGAFRRQSRITVEAIDDLRRVIAGQKPARTPLLGNVAIARKLAIGVGTLVAIAACATGAALWASAGMAQPGVATLRFVIVASGLAVMGGIGVLGWSTMRYVVLPISRLTHLMLQLEQGRPVEIPTYKQRDEIGALAEAVQAFKAGDQEKRRADAEADDLRRAADEARQRNEQAQRDIIARERAIVAESIGAALASLAAKDLSYRLSADLPEAYRSLKSDFNAALDQLESAMRHVTDSAGTIRTGTQEIATAADNMSRRTEHQAAALEQTAAALHQITVTVDKSAAGADQAHKVASAANEDAKNGASVMREAVDAMDAIADSARKISQIIGVIDEIAFQTNLLALNAGVEAARAGEAGRGFAVVASEVRALALRSADAAKEIKRLISASEQQVDVGVELVAATRKSLEQIENRVSEINEVVAFIASGAKEQSAALAEVNAAIGQMDQVTQQNAAMAEQSTAATGVLVHETEALSQSIGEFRLGDGERRAFEEEAPLKRLQAAA
ncbi:MAG: CZB domain-containing protein [Hyphomicrobiales bacterium]|nr:CZB domain-containing protein [Hyphomicrobiales bacterium]